MEKEHKEALRRAEESLEKVKKDVEASEYRQRYHFMTPGYWLNDPNGVIYMDGEYHAFYQHNPYGIFLGPMHWGHAKSKDLVHWEHLPIALAPSEEYELYPEGVYGCYSGSTLYENGVLYAVYTASRGAGEKNVQVQCLARSYDQGTTFVKEPSNPIISRPPECGSRDFRDPKIWEHEGKYYMICGTCSDGFGKVVLYRSDNMTDWEFFNVMAESRGEYGKMWECPDFFELDGRYVLVFSPMGLGYRKTFYMTGDFDYESGRFSMLTEGEVDWGFDYYAPQSFEDGKGRRIMLGWANNWDWMPWFKDYGPTQKDKWCGSFALPREVKICEDNRLSFAPVEELKILRNGHKSYEELEIGQEEPLNIEAGDGISFELDVSVDRSKTTAEQFWFELRAGQGFKTVVLFDLKNGMFKIDRSDADGWSRGVQSCTLEDRGKEEIKAHIFVDRSSVEVFTDRGRTVMSANIFPKDNCSMTRLCAKGGKLRVKRIDAWGLDRA